MLQEKAEYNIVRNLKVCQMLKEKVEGISDAARES
jgi:hypothetical protein